MSHPAGKNFSGFGPLEIEALLLDNACKGVRVYVRCFSHPRGPCDYRFSQIDQERRDWWNSRDFPVGLGDAWTGKYTLGGLIFTYAVIILFGLLLVGIGVVLLVRSFSG
jgi:hypothetical protein